MKNNVETEKYISRHDYVIYTIKWIKIDIITEKRVCWKLEL